MEIGKISREFVKRVWKIGGLKKANISHNQTISTLCGLVMPYGDLELCQHWLR